MLFKTDISLEEKRSVFEEINKSVVEKGHRAFAFDLRKKCIEQGDIDTLMRYLSLGIGYQIEGIFTTKTDDKDDDRLIIVYSGPRGFIDS